MFYLKFRVWGLDQGHYMICARNYKLPQLLKSLDVVINNVIWLTRLQHVDRPYKYPTAESSIRILQLTN
jgi:hypothetical protein